MKFNKVKGILSAVLVGIFALTTVSTVLATEKSFDKKEEEKISYDNDYGDLKRKIVGYFPEWAYKSKEHNYFNVTDLQWDSLTHIQYSFAMVDPATNKIAFGDKFAALEESFEGADLSYKGEKITLDENLPYKGHFNLLQQMKKRYSEVDLLISVGGWAGSRGFYTMMDTDQGIETFTDSAIKFIRDYGFDGVDIDFEFPSSTTGSGNPDDFDVSEPRRKTINKRYNVMMKRLREKLDIASKEDGKEYLLTAAVSGSSWVLGGVDSNEFAKYLDFLSIMSYDYHGGWNEFVENQANIYPDPADRETAAMIMPVLGMDWSYKYYRGVLPAEKILMGIPYYSRGWENVQGGNGTGLHGSSKTPATGKYNIWGDLDANGNEIPAGANPLWHLLNLMEQDSNLKIHWDEVGKVPYIWQNNEKVFLTFENERSIDERLKYIEEKNLGGALIWVMDGDYGLNPNYKEGSTDINEGKYTYGDTLTKRLRDGLNSMGDAKKTVGEENSSEFIEATVKLKGSYDHPNYTYDFEVTNNSNEKLEGGWELSFDLPKSAKFKSTWGGTVTERDNGDFVNITIKSSGWQTLEPGASTNLQGMIGLCFSDVRNIKINGKTPTNGGNITPPEEVSKPIITGAIDKTIYLGDSFDKMDGIKATDKKDGDITASIEVKGEVDRNKVGSYTLEYKVTNSAGEITTVNRVITVVEKEEPKPEENNKPVISGADNKTIYVGDSFNALENVTAFDKEDGDITSKIKVTGTVDSTKAGIYKLVYTVSDSKGLETTAERIITVKEKPTTSGDTYDGNKVYLAGDIVIYNGKEFVAKWWTQGENPENSAAWEQKVEINPDGSQEYISGKAYVGGDIVIYNGKKYKAKWWTNTTPGSDESWESIN